MVPRSQSKLSLFSVATAFGVHHLSATVQMKSVHYARQYYQFNTLSINT